MQDDSSKVHRSLNLQLARIAAEKAARGVDSFKKVRQSVASQVFGPKNRFAQNNNTVQTTSPKPYEFGFSVLNKLKKINVLKNPMSRPSSISEYRAQRSAAKSSPKTAGTSKP